MLTEMQRLIHLVTVDQLIHNHSQMNKTTQFLLYIPILYIIF